MNFDDPRIRQLSYVVLCIMALAMFVAASYCTAIAYEYLVINNSRGNDAGGLAKLMSYLPQLQNSKLQDFSSLVGILVAATPLMVAPVCVETTDNQRRLTRFGVGLMYVLLVDLLVAVVAYLAIDPQAWFKAQAHTLDLEQLTTLQDTSRTVIRGCVFFLAALLGLKAVK